MSKKILIAYATYGSGHKMVAKYLYNYFKEQENPNLEVKIVNIMDYSNKLGDMSINLFNKNFEFRSNIPFNVVYEFFDHRLTTIPYKFITRTLFTDQLEDLIVDYNPDILISSHFFASIMMDIIKTKYNLNTKIITILTDYISHQMWIKNKNKSEAYIVSNEVVKRQLIKDKIKPSIIYAYGIPLSDKFKVVDFNKKEIKNEYGITNRKPVYLFFGGGTHGSSFSYNFLKSVLELRLDVNIIFVAGKNELLKGKVEYLVKVRDYKNVKVLGYTMDISRLMAISNLIITKPGGLNLTEALEMKKPLLLIPGNGGQENYNAKFVKRNGFGVYCHNPKKTQKMVYKLYHHPEIIDRFNYNLTNYKENDSTKKIYKLVLDMLTEEK